MADIDQIPAELVDLSKLIDQKLESFASGSKEIQVAALNATKFVFDLAVKSEAASRPRILDLLSSLTQDEAPQTRSQARSQDGKRKRSPSPARRNEMFQITPLPSLFIDGMHEAQIWEQLDLRAKTLCEVLEDALEGNAKEDPMMEPEIEGEELRKALLEGEVGLEDMSDVDWDIERSSEEEGNKDDESSQDGGEVDSDGESEDLGEDIMQELRDPSSENDGDDGIVALDLPGKTSAMKALKRKRGHSELDDDFFDLAAFNAEIDEAEAMLVSKGRLGGDDNESDDDMSVDLFASVDGKENFAEDDIEEDGADPFYRDFFDPPPKLSSTKLKAKRKAKPLTLNSPRKHGKVRFHEEVRVRNIKSNGKNLPVSSMYDDDDDDEDGGDEDEYGEQMIFDDENMDRGEGFEEVAGNDEDDQRLSKIDEDENEESVDIINRLKDDLFADEEEVRDVDLTTHEKRMSSLREQIGELEKENVARKDWVLMGEATSRGRPQNSLLEEDLGFERSMKAVPTVTEETVQALEERIKARILEGQFDDVARQRPIDDKPFLPSRLLELQDTKSSQSLAQIYEDEYSAAQASSASGDDRDGNLKKQHEEIEMIWDGICSKLDALCNAHFMPKQPKATITSVNNVSAITVESALPTSKSAATMLAPEEVFAAKSADARARSELAPAEKRALRSKERKLRKKSRDVLDKSVDKYAKKVRGIGGVKKQKEAALKSVVKIGKGVTVVGKTAKDVLAKKEKMRR